MKYLFALLFITTIGHAQPIALLDLGFKKPFVYTNCLTETTILNGNFPLYLNDIDAVVATIENLPLKINRELNNEDGTEKITLGHSILILQTQTTRHKKRYNITLATESDFFKAYMTLVSGSFDREAQKRILIFIDYLKNNASIAGDASVGAAAF